MNIENKEESNNLREKNTEVFKLFDIFHNCSFD